MMGNDRKQNKGLLRWFNVYALALLVVAVLWGSSLVVVKDTTNALRPNFLLACRFSIASLVLLPFGFQNLRRCTKKDWRSGLIIGVLLFSAYSVQTLGVTMAPAGRSGFLSATYCVMVPFLSWAITSRMPQKNQVLAAVLCFIGVSFVAMGGDFSSLTAELSVGDGLALLSGLLFASHIVAVGHWGKGIDPLVVTLLQFIVAGVCAWAVSFLGESWRSQSFQLSAMAGVLYLALFCTAAALFLQNWGQKGVSPASAGILLGLESVFSVIFSFIFHGEQITPWAMMGFSLIFLAIMLAEVKLSWKKKKKSLSS